MADPRLNLNNYSNTTLNRSPVNPTINPSLVPSGNRASVTKRLQQASTAANAALSSTIGVVGSFANLAGGEGGGVVGTGLVALAALSDSVRINGISSLPTIAITNPQKYVLEQVGIDQAQLVAAQQFNPSVVAAALAEATTVYTAVSQGTFTTGSIAGAFSSLQNAYALLTSLYTPNLNVQRPSGSAFGTLPGGTTNYAQDLIALAPKYKFLYVVQFEFDPEFQSDVSKAINPAFVIKTSTRPNVEFEYEEVNMYNFRTKIPKRTMYEPITMKFLDDDKNNAFQFYTTYLKLLSPIANIDGETTASDLLDLYDQSGGGMGFESTPQPISAGFTQTVGQGYAASLGAFGTNTTRNILRRVTIFHVYRQGRMMNVMNFYNPKIQKMELDELDMGNSEGTEVGLTFSYDSVFIIPGYRIYNDQNQPNYNLYDITNSGTPFLLDSSATVNDNGNLLKDGFGMAFGQDTLSSAAPSTLSTVPLNTGGGNGTIPTSTSAGDPDSLNEVVVTAQPASINPDGNISYGNNSTTSTFTDPVSSSTQTSANTSTDVSNTTTSMNNELTALTMQYNKNATATPTPTPAQQTALYNSYITQYNAIIAKYKSTTPIPSAPNSSNPLLGN